MRLILTLCFFLIFFSAFAQRIDECLKVTPLKIVVVGGSTALGSGASTSDSSFVERFEKFLKNYNQEYRIYNLSQDSLTTFHLLPENFKFSDRPQPDKTKNISQAIGWEPDLILMSIPNLDASMGWTIDEHQRNIDLIAQKCINEEVPLWVITPHPQNLTANQVEFLKQSKDYSLHKFGEKAFDFWTDFVEGDSLKSIYANGNGLLNNLGHHLIFEKLAARLPYEHVVKEKVVDYGIYKEEDSFFRHCTGDSVNINILYTNLGIDTSIEVCLLYFDHTGSDVAKHLQNIKTCEIDTINYHQPELSEWYIVSDFSLGLPRETDVFLENNRLEYEDYSDFEILEIKGLDPSYHYMICNPDSIKLNPVDLKEEQLNWFSDSNRTDLIFEGEEYNSGILENDTSFWIQSYAIGEDRNFILESEGAVNSYSNKMICDIVTNDKKTLRTLFTKGSFSDSNFTEIYLKTGSSLGFETLDSNWTYWDKVNNWSLDQNSGNWFRNLRRPIELHSDTIGIYLINTDSSSIFLNSTYPEALEVKDNNLEVTNVRGFDNESNDFVAKRLIGGWVYFISDNNRYCSRESEVIIKVGANFDLGRDTFLKEGESITLEAPLGFNTYAWSTGTREYNELIEYDQLEEGDNEISVQAFKWQECSGRDTIIITKITPTSTEDHPFGKSLNYTLSPNPGNGTYHLKGHSAKAKIEVFNALGQQFYKNEIRTPARFDWTDFNEGQYFLKISKENQTQVIPFYHMK